MRYQRVTEVVRLAIDLQGARGGLTLDDIRAEFAVSRRTAERLRDAVEAAFGPLEMVDVGDKRRHWRLQSAVLRHLLRVSLEELTELGSAARWLDRAGLTERAGALRELAGKLRALRRPISITEFDSDLELVMRTEGLAMRPGPRPRLQEGLVSLLREAIRASRRVEFDYLAQSTQRRSRQRVEPYGLLYGNRAFLVGRAGWADDTRLWRLANVSEARVTNEAFERDPEFDLQSYAERSFGVFQEPPVEVALRFDAGVARDAATFLFHPSQIVVANPDGSLNVYFRAGGLDEMCWHLVTWGDSVTVEKPARLRRRLARMCASLAAHHGA